MSETKTHYVKSLHRKISFRIIFITLTLPSHQCHSDNEIKEKCLNSFLIELTKYHNVHNYLWRAEKQKNGNIHFHLIIDKFVHYNELRRRWNRICNKLGYVDRYSDKMKQFHANGFHYVPSEKPKYSYETQLKAYHAGQACSWTSPNSTDIHSIRLINDVQAYVCKYATKDEIANILIVKKKEIDKFKLDEKEQRIFDSLTPEVIEKYKSLDLAEFNKLIVEGRIWGCNQELSNIKGAQSYVDSEIEEAIAKTIIKSKCRVFHDAYFSVYYIDIETLKQTSPNVLFLMFADYMSSHFNFSMQLVT